MGGWQEKNTVGQKKRRNEALDCFVYALAALRIVFPAGSWISVRCWRACRKRRCSNQQENTGRLRPCLIRRGE